MWTWNLDNKHGDGTCLIQNITFIRSFSASDVSDQHMLTSTVYMED